MPSRSVRSAAALALATSVTSFAYVGSAAPAQAAGYNGYCKTSSGVTVVVDFRELGGGVAVRCAPVGSGASGVQALQAAGIPVQGTRQYGLAFLCRIYGKPSATATLPGDYHESCGRTPPPNAHWWYTQARNGGSWSSSGAGAATSHVIPGGFEGWAFSEGGTNYSPRFTPSRPPAPPKPAPTHKTTEPPAPPRHTTTTAPKNTKATAPKGGSTPGKGGDSGSNGSQSKSTTASTAAKASKAAKKKAAEKKASGSAAHASTSSTAKHPTGSSSSSSGGVTGTSSGGPTNVAVANSDDLIKDSKKSSGVNATTVVGGIVLVALAVGGGAVAIIRKRNLG